MVDVAVVVVGGGQAGLATGFALRRAGLVPGRDFVILDAGSRAGGAWRHMWEGLRLFSPAGYSSLPGWMMPAWADDEGYPPRSHVVNYLERYEERYELSVLRPHQVEAVTRGDGPDDRFRLDAGDLAVTARVVVSATGTWDRPFWPSYPGMRVSRGRQLHADVYQRPEDFAGLRVAIVGGGNSAAQILAEVSRVAETLWFTTRPPRFLPDDVDGRALFAAATARVQALREGREHEGVGGLGDVVMVASVREARDRGVLQAEPMFERMTARGLARADGTERAVDAVIWCTGFRPALRHLAPLHVRSGRGGVDVGGPAGTQSVAEPRLHLVGYGDWTGPASATLLGVGRSARDTAAVVVEQLTGGRARRRG